MVEHASHPVYPESLDRPRPAAAARRAGAARLQAPAARRRGRLGAAAGQPLAGLPVRGLLDAQGPPCRETVRKAPFALLPRRPRELLESLLRALRGTIPRRLRG